MPGDSLALFAQDAYREELFETDDGIGDDEQEGGDLNMDPEGDYDKAKAKAAKRQAALNNNPQRFGSLGCHPNLSADPERAWLASKSEIEASEEDALLFSDVTIPNDKVKSAGYTAHMNQEEAWEAGRRVYENAVRQSMNDADTADSKPGVWRPLTLDQEITYDKLLRLCWPWALKYTRALSFGKRLAVDSIPALHVLTKSVNLVGVGASYASGPDGHKEFEVKDAEGADTGVRGLSGNIEGNMLFTFFKENLTAGDAALEVDILCLDTHQPMNANGHKYHQDDVAAKEPFKLDIREYNKKCTEGERRVAELSVSTFVYYIQDMRDARGLAFPFFRMGNYMRLDVDIHAAREDKEEIEVSDMAHCK